MRKTIFGAILMLSGLLLSAILLAGAVEAAAVSPQGLNAWQVLAQSKTLAVELAGIVIAAAGLVLALLGLADKSGGR